jgi:hypothetical protein
MARELQLLVLVSRLSLELAAALQAQLTQHLHPHQ